MLEVEQNSTIRAIVVCPCLIGDNRRLSPDRRLNEAVDLSKAINVDICYFESLILKEIKSATYFSKGVIEKIGNIATQNDAFLLIVDTSLTPVQQRNLEKALNLKVIDRTALILEIFGERAKTSEGKLQVELAHLTYQRSRLVRSWTHLERQRGGAGFLGGPGEKQIELDKRLLDDKIVKIKKALQKVKNTRTLQRGNRKKVPYPVVALTGYTNAGKSSLFNLLTQQNVMVADQLFATLDTVVRKIKWQNDFEAVLSDTVGFISDLPHELVMAFRSTLEEVLEADVIIHVRDISNPDTEAQRKDVLDVLHHLGLKDIETQNNYIEVLNKIDLLSLEDKNILLQKISRRDQMMVAVSAVTGEGVDDLIDLIKEKLKQDQKVFQLCLPVHQGKALSIVYQYAEVDSITQDDDNLYLTIKTDDAKFHKLTSLLNKPEGNK